VKRLVVSLIAVLATWFGVAPSATAVYDYDGHRHSADLTSTNTGRGPPVGEVDTTAIYTTADSRSRGALVRPDVHQASSTYDVTPSFVHRALPGASEFDPKPTTTSERVRWSGRPLLSPGATGVAAKNRCSTDQDGCGWRGVGW
jgi:hypothetical protein